MTPVLIRYQHEHHRVEDYHSHEVVAGSTTKYVRYCAEVKKVKSRVFQVYHRRVQSGKARLTLLPREPIDPTVSEAHPVLRTEAK